MVVFVVVVVVAVAVVVVVVVLVVVVVVAVAFVVVVVVVVVIVNVLQIFLPTFHVFWSKSISPTVIWPTHFKRNFSTSTTPSLFYQTMYWTNVC